MIRTIRRNIQRNYASCAGIGVEVKGRTLVNLLGKDGNFEVDSNSDGVADGWIAPSLSASIQTTGVEYGSKYQRIGNFINSGDGSYKTITVASGKYYVFLARVKHSLSAGSAQVRIKTGTITKSSGSSLSASSSWATSYGKFLSDGTEDRAYICMQGTTNPTGDIDVDAYRLYEIPVEIYSKIDVDPAYTGEALGRMYPFVESCQFKQGILCTTKGKNLVDTDVSAWEQGYISPSTGALVVGVNYLRTINYTPAKENTVYAQSCAYGYVYPYPMYCYDVNYNFLGTYSPTPIGTKFVKMVVRYNVASPILPSEIPLIQPQLELGSTATVFEPQTKAQFHVPLKLAQDESVFAMPSGQSVFVQKWVKDVALTGDLAWVSYQDNTANHSAYISNSTLLGIVPTSMSLIMTKTNGLFMTPVSSGVLSDTCYVGGSSTVLNVPDVETGFPETYTATSNEWKAWAYGFRMTNPTGTSAWDGVSAKNWIRITDLGGRTTICPVSTYAGYTPYTLAYRLATAKTHFNYVDNDLSKPILSPGSALSLPIGIAQIEQRTGIDWTTKADLANKYSSTVDVGVQVNNPTIPAYTETFTEQNVGIYAFPAQHGQRYISTERVGQTTTI